MTISQNKVNLVGDIYGGTITSSRETLQDVERSIEKIKKDLSDDVGTASWPAVAMTVGKWKSETTAQRYYGRTTVYLDDQVIHWLDMEVPTERGGSRVDLLGGIEEDKQLRCFCEMKYAENNSPGNGSPISALFQALRYAINAKRSANEMLDVPGHKDRANTDGWPDLFSDGWYPTLLVAANAQYWKFWRKKLGEHFSELAPLGDAIAELLGEEFGREVWIKWASFDDLPDHTPTTDGDYEVEAAETPNPKWENVF